MAKQRVNILSRPAIETLRADHERLRMQVQMLEQRLRALSQLATDEAPRLLKECIVFRLNEDLTTSDDSAEAAVIYQMGQGYDRVIVSPGTITVLNWFTDALGWPYKFEGSCDDWGVAYWTGGDREDMIYRIVYL